MAEIATFFLSPLLQVFYEKMASSDFVGFFRQQKLSDGLLKKLKTTFLTLNAVFEDAEELQVTKKPAVKEWLDELKDAIYDAEDVLDEIATEALLSELDVEFQAPASKVRKLSSSVFRNSSVKEIELKIKEVLERLETLAQQIDLLGLRVGVGGKLSERLPTTSLVEESDICGRNGEKEEIINLLLADDARGNEMGVIAIVGMGGIGKTTLAQSVYNNDKVKEHFNIDAWVCVSEEFDVFKITKTIIEVVTLSSCHLTDLNQLQFRLKECLTGKKFLLVLDDVWNETYDHWETLCKPFKYGAQGSKVIVTTRSDRVVSIARAMPHRLMELPEEDCWSLFAKHAFHDGNSNAHGKLEVIGRKIIKKCGALPLAVKTIGALLRSKPDVDEWDKILRSELWDLSIDEIGNILPALRLSYKYLPSHLKRCFAYSSIFPKDYAFKKDQLIMLWMAKGFLQQPKNKTMEEVGNEHFLALESRSLFQKSSDNKSCFIMHDLVSDLAKSISGNFIIRLEGDCSRGIVNNTRHMSYFFQENFHRLKMFKTLDRAKRLHTFLHCNMSGYISGNYYLTKKVVQDLLPTLRSLRVLSLSNYQNIAELLDLIGKFKYLRYLDLSSTNVKRLPDSICNLCNLQTLILLCCMKLTSLPRDMRKLVSLSHLDITGTGIKDMPIQLGGLKCLQTLTEFIVGKGNGLCIGELKKLTNLRRSLSILELQNVESPTDVLNATSLRDRKYLEKLELRWKYDNNFSESQRSILDSLQPHTNLKSHTIKSYSGKSFSDWVGHPSFSNVTSLYLERCTYCSSLPPLGQLPSLQNLSIVGLDEVVRVGHEFCGSSSSSVKPFGALKVLRLAEMPKWEEWVSFGDENGGGAFPQLERLSIWNCPKLIGELPVHLSSLSQLFIGNCPQLVAPLPLPPTIRELNLAECNEMFLKELPTGMEKLVIERFYALESLPKGMINSNSSLQALHIYGCPSLMSLPNDGLPSALKTLHIRNCKKLELSTHLDYSSLKRLTLLGCHSLKSFSLDLFPKLYDIQIKECSNLESLTVPEHDLVTLQIKIRGCPNFVSFPKGGLRAPSLTTLNISDCENLKSLPEKMQILLLSLESLYIRYCPEVESFPEGGLPSKLNSISINVCEKLIASRMGWGLQNLPILKHFSIDGKNEDLESFPEAQLLPTSLTSLSISRFPNLKSLDKKGLQHLIALEQLDIESCPKLKFMPEQGLPASLSILKIWFCPLLKKEWQSKKGKEWRKIAHVEQIWIDRKPFE
ncbi:putative disease resistance RPP13-like protein 1 [Alnus glutinosa]|uniref:putative disease resistance RPP13-like protein 1 n=1 Tax=Alnus glutinosa TaxID=3517 RepID=UPI002D76641B|nr:putative disease resistance RPP13-like protein 1 [Alnus glutinosa]XP_062174615.1 putative disease resistance RPP13-like protein 1 [Alnus glutinosa]XP_062174616.1 putative disease resistance RPP13-like protein 1 [Alnus glutinosa]XP_062174617.1 putative disease resistance RPP13-like protein 1 [Alnus glutinosa]XP_062174618.1 putative disease resistance RPP13-like protein 1 [Alnus glutinosa]XP_062174619.1 putative disease resistance RPP13-like protein 1 [Alnus glutinosa]XP_062174620.1 putative